MTPPRETNPPPDLPRDPSLTYDPTRARRDTLAMGVRLQAATPELDSVTGTPEGMRADTPADENFTLHTRIGSGGMGEVWEGSQRTLLRTIAVKTIRRDLLARASSEEYRTSILRDFAKEAITNAALEHPNIVPVYDLGSDGLGEPMLGMKLVRGKNWEDILDEDLGLLPAAEFVTKHVLILIAVAQAVAFAHSRGVVHRDLKPGQVMIGDFGEVLLMDWGLAIVYDVDLCRQRIPQLVESAHVPTCVTGSNPAGTPAYMAPEQTGPTCHTIGPWTDVFLLGGTLYRVLTGTPPYGATTASEAFWEAADCKLTPPQVRAPAREIPAELSALVLAAMAKGREDRVPSAMAFVDALKDYLTGAGKRRESEALVEQAYMCFLNSKGHYRLLNKAANSLDQAIALWPQNPSIASLREELFSAYASAALANGDLTLARLQAERIPEGDVCTQLLKDIDERSLTIKRDARQRRILQVSTALLIAVVTLSFFVMRDIRSRAEAAEQRAANARERADESRKRAEIFRDLNALRQGEFDLVEKLKAAVPRPIEVFNRTDAPDERRRQRDLIDKEAFRQLIDQRDALRKERTRLEGIVPEGASGEPVELSLAEANFILVTDPDTSASLARAMDLYRKVHLANPRSPEPQVGLAAAHTYAGELGEAATLLADAAKIARDTLGPKHPDYANILSFQGLVGSWMLDKGSEFSTYYYEALSILEPRFQQDAANIGAMYLQVGNNQRALEYTSTSLSLSRRLYGMNDSRTGSGTATQGVVFLGLGRDAEAEQYLAEAQKLTDDLYGQDHYESIIALGNIAALARKRGDFEKSHALTAEAVARTRRMNPPNPDLLARLLLETPREYILRGKQAEAIPLMEEPIEILRKNFGDNDRRLFDAQILQARLLSRVDRLEEAIAMLKPVFERMKKSIGVEHPVALKAQGLLANMLMDAGHPEESDAVVQSVISVLKKRGFRDGGEIVDALGQICDSLNGRGEYQRSKEIMLEILPFAEATYGKDAVQLGTIYHYLALAEGQLGNFEGMLSWSLKSVAVRKKVYGENAGMLAGTYFNVAISYDRTGRTSEAIPYLRKALAIMQASYGPGANDAMTCLQTLADFLERDGQREAAIAECDKAITRIRETTPVRPFGLSMALAKKAELVRSSGRNGESFDIARGAAQTLLDAGGRDESITSDGAAMMASLLQGAGRVKEGAMMRVADLATRYSNSRMAGLMKPFQPAFLQEPLMDIGDAAGVLRALRLTEETLARPVRYGFGLGGDSDRFLINGYDQATSAALTLQPPNRALAQRLARRAAAVFALQGTDPDSSYGRWIGRELPARLGIAAEVEGIVTKTEPMKEGFPLCPDFLAAIDAIEPAIDWEREAPEVSGWGIGSLLATYPGAIDETIRLIREGKLE